MSSFGLYLFGFTILSVGVITSVARTRRRDTPTSSEPPSEANW